MSNIQYCEDCEHCIVDTGDILEYAKCSKAMNPDGLKLSRISREFSPTKYYYYCSVERTKDTCKNFKPKNP